MTPRPPSNFASLFETIIEDIRIHLAASVDKSLTDFSRRLTRLERRFAQLDVSKPLTNTPIANTTRTCSLCERSSMARGLCSAHYQQWRYRQRKSKNIQKESLATAKRYVFTSPLKTNNKQTPANEYVTAAFENNAVHVDTTLPTNDCK
ncbi:MAG: hypothetical protein JW841_17860 [Deltaproteobacteria bacterium]|nr:hypothetical protein [Deltaproteobacteria bacterium]